MTTEELDQLRDARTALERAREIRVVFKTAWYQVDDLDPEAEEALKQALRNTFRDWAENHGTSLPAVPEDVRVFSGRAFDIMSISGLLDEVVGSEA